MCRIPFQSLWFCGCLFALLLGCNEAQPVEIPDDDDHDDELCADGIDNDLDSYVDCEDQDCWGEPECAGDDDDSAGDDDDLAGDDDSAGGDDDDSALPCTDVDGDGTCLADDCDDFDLLLNGADADGDGVSTCAGDCDDDAAAVNPLADELCDGADNNCNGQVDEAGATGETTWYLDADGDGYGRLAGSIAACAQPPGYVADSNDCDDVDAAAYPGATEVCDEIDNDCNNQVDEGLAAPGAWFADFDSDGFGNPALSAVACIAPPNYIADSSDCNDLDPAVNTSATEVCDGVDNNCDSQVDDGTAAPTTWYADLDGDSFGNASMSTLACDPPLGYITDSSDCDDLDATSYPGGTEVCDGTDNNCAGGIDEGVGSTFYADADADNYGDPGTPLLACSLPIGASSNNLDCNDALPFVHPAAAEACDGIDNNCAGGIDEGFDSDGDGVNSCGPDGIPGNSDDDCDDGEAASYPGNTELCDALDNDCAGGIDEGFDGDGDGFSTCGADGIVGSNDDDCDDSSSGAVTNPAATEICDGIDNDCDNLLDDIDPGVSLVGAPTFYADSDSDGLGDPLSPTQACAQPAGTVTNNGDCDDSSALDTDNDGTQDCADDDIDGDGLPNSQDADPTDPSVVNGPVAGSGSDGVLTVGGTTVLDLGTAVTGDPDAGDTTITVADASSIGVGDEVLVLSHQVADQGLFEFLFVTAVNGNTLSIVPPMTIDFSPSSVIALYRVPHYTDVTVPSGATLATTPWDGSVGGVLVFRATGDVIVDGDIEVSALGFRGGPGVAGNSSAPLQGESYPGVGSAGNAGANSGGGGAHPVTGDRGESGGGGAYGSGGGNGTQSDGQAVTSGGNAYGDASLSLWYLGSGGGAGSPDAEGDGSSSSNVTGAGGTGGGLLAVFVGQSITLSGSITSNGANGADAVSGGGEVGGGGGAAGGQIQLSAPSIVITGLVSAVGGSGGRSYGDSGVYGSGIGGSGGDGRVRIDYDTLNGVAFPGGDLSVSDPDAGHQQSPGN